MLGGDGEGVLRCAEVVVGVERGGKSSSLLVFTGCRFRVLTLFFVGEELAAVPFLRRLGCTVCQGGLVERVRRLGIWLKSCCHFL